MVYIPTSLYVPKLLPIPDKAMWKKLVKYRQELISTSTVSSPASFLYEMHYQLLQVRLSTWELSTVTFLAQQDQVASKS